MPVYEPNRSCFVIQPEGLPVGVQIIGRLFEDALVLGVAERLEASERTRWHRRTHHDLRLGLVREFGGRDQVLLHFLLFLSEARGEEFLGFG